MGVEGLHADHKTARMAMSLEGFWTIMQASTQQGTQKKTFVAWHGGDWITRPTDPVFAPSDFHLFPALKSTLSERHFRSDEEVRLAVMTFLRSLGTDYYQDGFLKLISRHDKCINIGGEYFLESSKKFVFCYAVVCFVL
ncbi:hypothetical protein AVEN_18727-1 [Araneus ventricosus]|uniref:Uncharacterized protein n=1 Tax=Araneus ventricosus TaxID=182803 RepID=A0A4Y2GKS5_ARAVE|nr:hypothetical protein AVEN_18727-1 [Araneus ventricosus]